MFAEVDDCLVMLVWQKFHICIVKTEVTKNNVLTTSTIDGISESSTKRLNKTKQGTWNSNHMWGKQKFNNCDAIACSTITSIKQSLQYHRRHPKKYCRFLLCTQDLLWRHNVVCGFLLCTVISTHGHLWKTRNWQLGETIMEKMREDTLPTDPNIQLTEC